ncbi:MAG: type II toxin-antitoxin system HicB family antitoxin [Burkholderiales bacterium]|nr:type II toxin-antitoxin system HicB family antitoxin [Burkholderiales bacterium]
MTSELSYTVIFERNESEGYTVTVPALPGLVTEGANKEEAKVMVRDAIACYLEGLVKDGEPIPVEREISQERVEVAFGGA